MVDFINKLLKEYKEYKETKNTNKLSEEEERKKSAIELRQQDKYNYDIKRKMSSPYLKAKTISGSFLEVNPKIDTKDDKKTKLQMAIDFITPNKFFLS